LVWPWGDTFDPGKLPAAVRDVQPVGSYPAGASPFGVFDMAGNVAEWVADVYDSAFYAGSPASNPKNAGDGAARIYHGGAFDNLDGAAYTTSHRYTKPRTFNDVDVGFRCARDATEVNGSASPEEHKAVVAKFCQAYGAYKPGAPCP
jgi:formylglycine-generating enzyme required for sulfatase activity